MTVLQEKLLERKLINGLHTVLLAGGMLLLLGGLAWIFAGPMGLMLLAGLFLFSASLLRGIPSHYLLRMLGARPLHPAAHPSILPITEWLSRRAGLPRTPALYRIPSPVQNALTTGSETSASIGVTDGILRSFSDRELAGILAHEISHIRNRDTLVMGLAALAGRFTAVLSQIGIFLLFFNLPLMLMGYYVMPWFALLLLLFAPTLNAVMTLALSRAREYHADLEAAKLTGDPRGLALALAKLERMRKPWWERIFLPMRRTPASPLLLTHPPTEERIRRLLELAPPEAPAYRITA